jgi:D-xylose transport system ATP-binding protein
VIKVVSGVTPRDTGSILLEGSPAPINTPHDARQLGIETIYQDLALLDNLDAPANLFLGREIRKRSGLRDDKAMAKAAAEALHRVNPRFCNFTEPVKSLSGGQRQAIAIARALHFDARILILDEPTAALGPRETELFKELVLRVKMEGVGILLISHSINDVLELTDRLAVMAGGRLVAMRKTSETTESEVLEMIIVGGTEVGTGQRAEGRESATISEGQ